MIDIEKHDFDDENDEFKRLEEDDEVDSLDLPKERTSQLKPLSLNDEGVYYEYGPKMQETRYKYQEHVVKATRRAKVKIYSDQKSVDITATRFFSDRG